jgi:hypothetical protein
VVEHLLCKHEAHWGKKKSPGNYTRTWLARDTRLLFCFFKKTRLVLIIEYYTPIKKNNWIHIHWYTKSKVSEKVDIIVNTYMALAMCHRLFCAFMCKKSFNFCYDFMKWVLSLFHFVDKQAEASNTRLPRSYIWYGGASSVAQFYVLKHGFWHGEPPAMVMVLTSHACRAGVCMKDRAPLSNTSDREWRVTLQSNFLEWLSTSLLTWSCPSFLTLFKNIPFDSRVLFFRPYP